MDPGAPQNLGIAKADKKQPDRYEESWRVGVLECKKETDVHDLGHSGGRGGKEQILHCEWEQKSGCAELGGAPRQQRGFMVLTN